MCVQPSKFLSYKFYDFQNSIVSNDEVGVRRIYEADVDVEEESLAQVIYRCLTFVCRKYF